MQIVRSRPRADGPVIAAETLTREYPTEAGPVRALRGVSLAVKPGEFLCLPGPSGSGKSTLLSLLAGLDRPTRGRVAIAGNDLDGLDETGLALLRRRHVGFIFQSFNLIASMTALENVELPARFGPAPLRQVRARAKELLRLVGLADRLHHLPAQLPGGQRQRVAIARALINRPGLIIGDEPTGNLDSETGQKVLDLLDAIRRREGCALILATHDPRVAARADRVITLQDGRILREEVNR